MEKSHRQTLHACDRGREWEGNRDREDVFLPELSKVLSLSDRISSALVLSLEKWCAHYSQDSLCGVFYLHIPSPLSPDCCSRLTANVTTKINQEMFNGEIKKE